MLPLPCLSLAESPLGIRRVRRIHIKGVTARFDFDGLRISQIHQSVENKATGTPQVMFYNHL